MGCCCSTECDEDKYVLSESLCKLPPEMSPAKAEADRLEAAADPSHGVSVSGIVFEKPNARPPLDSRTVAGEC